MSGVPIKVSSISSTYLSTTILVREPNGKVTRFFGSLPLRQYIGNNKTYTEYVDLNGKQARKLIALMKKHRKLKVSIMGVDGNYVFDLDCRGFTKAWRKTVW